MTRFRHTPMPLLRILSAKADQALGEEIQRMTRADIGFAWALWEAMEIDTELEQRGGYRPRP